MPLRRSRLCFRPAVVDLSSGEKNRSWRTNAAARQVCSVALVIYPPEFTAHLQTSELPDFRTSERVVASGEASLTSSQWVFFRSDGTETERGKEAGRRRYFETVGSVVALPESTPSTGGNKHRREPCA